MLIAFATAFTISVTAFADGVPENMADTTWYANNTSGTNRNANNTGVTGFANNTTGTTDTTGRAGTTGTAGNTNTTGDSVLFLPETAGTGATGSRSVSPMNLEWGDDTASVTINANEIFYVFNEGERVGKILEPGDLLTPGEEYVFNVYYATAPFTGTPTDLVNTANSARVTKGMLDGGRLRVRTIKGSTSVASVTLDEKGSGTNANYQLTVNAKENYGTKTNDVEYALEVTGAGTNAVALVKSGVAFKIGYRKMSDDDIATYEEGDVVTIYNDTPVITKKQFETLAKNYNYKAITFEDENDTWVFTGRISGMGDTNWYNTEDIIPNVVLDYPETNFKFINFHGGVKLPTNGEMRINVSDISADYANMHVYLSRGGALTPITAAYDRETDEIVFKTNYLGTFIISEDVITTVTTEPTEPTEPNYEAPGTTAPTTPTNPATGGTATAMNLISAIGVAALTGAGSLIRKKK